MRVSCSETARWHHNCALIDVVITKGSFILALALGAVAFAPAQSRNSFQLVSGLAGLTSSLNGLTLDTALSSNASFVLNSQQYFITDVFGIWLLDDNDDFSASGLDIAQWNAHSNLSSTGGIAGWKTNPNTGLTPGQSNSLTFTSITGQAESYGYHVRIDGQLPGGSNTLYIQGAAVPEPASLAALGIGAAALTRRRKRK